MSVSRRVARLWERNFVHDCVADMVDIQRVEECKIGMRIMKGTMRRCLRVRYVWYGVGVSSVVNCVID